jgi:hypothetical protein
MRTRLGFVVLVLVGLVAGLSALTVSAEPPANTPFYRTWSYTDGPVAAGLVSRTWMWGPEANTGALYEPYAESPGGEREVQYYDKARMEITQPGADPAGAWYVTNGLLVMELVSGQLQLGNTLFEERQPSAANVAGDQDDPTGPTYQTIGTVLDDAPYSDSQVITNRLNRDGVIADDPSLASYGVTAAYRVTMPGLDHQVASPFWEFMNSTGLVSDGAMTFEGPLFSNPFYATGLPISEAYWANVKVGGQYKDVLLQCFERRCLTYTPDNEPGWRVEAGNVGRHYHDWRYGVVPPPADTLTIYLVDVGNTQGASDVFGCEDSLVPVQVAAEDLSDPVAAAVDSLLVIHDQYYGESGLYNALYQNSLSIESVNVSGDIATVYLSGEIPVGGVCDEPRVRQQLRATIATAAGVPDVQVFINGINLDEYWSPTGLVELQLFFVDLGNSQGAPSTFGCGDSLVAVTVSVENQANLAQAALETLLAVSDQNYGESGLYNALYLNQLTVDGVSIGGNTVTAYLSGFIPVGGVCDEPRVQEQLERTLAAAAGVGNAVIYINGINLDDYWGPFGPVEINLYLADLGNTQGQPGTFGCGDSLVAVPVEIESANSISTVVTNALAALFAIPTETYGPIYAHNSLYLNTVTIEGVTYFNGELTVQLTGEIPVGGACDVPRIEEQIYTTILQFESVLSAEVYLNGISLEDALASD